MRAEFRNRRGPCLLHGWFGAEQVDEDVAMQALASILPSNRSSVMAANKRRKRPDVDPRPSFSRRSSIPSRPRPLQHGILLRGIVELIGVALLQQPRDT